MRELAMRWCWFSHEVDRRPMQQPAPVSVYRCGVLTEHAVSTPHAEPVAAVAAS